MPTASSSSNSPAYSCGRCRQPLVLRISPETASRLSSLNLGDSTGNRAGLQESQYDLLASAIASAPLKNPSDAQFKDTTVAPILPRKTLSSSSSSTISPRKAATAQQKLFDTLSAQSSIDHPLCQECAEAWFASMNKEVEAQAKERERLLQYEADAKAKKGETAKRDEWLKTDTERLEKERVELEKRLIDRETEQRELEEEMRKLDEEEKELEKEEAQFWLGHSRYVTAHTDQVAKSRSLLASYTSTTSLLEKLQRTNVYADAFCIGHDGGLATINGLRLGRLPASSSSSSASGGGTAGIVDWAEINAAWGQTLLLLNTVARKLGCEIQGYRLIPMGSFSRIEKLDGFGGTQSGAAGGADKGTVMELYGSGDWALGRLLQNRRFDSAMVAFLECLRQVIVHAEDAALEAGEEELRIPHQVYKDKIGDVSIRLGSSDETWTRALRHVLLDLKILLAHACK